MIKTSQISSVNHPLIKHLVKLRQNSAYRYEHQSLIVEGIKPISEICQQHQPKVILTCDINILPQKLKSCEVIVVNEMIMNKVSGMVQSEGLLAEVQMPAENRLDGKKFIVAFDGINDPGNMGTLLRTSLALGWQGAFILENSCDPYNEKALRAGRGACFRLPIRHGTWQELEELMRVNHLQGFVADLDGFPPDDVDFDQGGILVLSNEAKGVSPRALEICKKISIPITSEMESLNVAAAGAILMYVLKYKAGAKNA